MKKVAQILLIVVCAFAGGFTAQVLLTGQAARAASEMSYLLLGDQTLPKGLEFYVQNGSPGQNFYAADGKIRLQLGTYPGAGERGLPLVSLNDNHGDIRMLLRLAGPNEAPVLIFKDRQHRDRMVMGLALSGEEEPFLATYDSSGKKTDVFGTY